jgi:hypothetical protein
MFAGWSPIGIAALVAIAGGVVLLVVYAAQRGLVHRDLEGIEAPSDGPADPTPAASTSPAAGADRAPAPAPRRSRTVGLAGALLLAVGLLLGAVAATGTWGGDVAGGPGLAPQDCAQAWEGCPKATP